MFFSSDSTSAQPQATQGADVNAANDTPLITAVRSRNHEAITALLAQGGTDVNQCGRDGLPPLLIAMQQWDHRATLLLCNAPGVDLNVLDGNNQSPLTWAVSLRWHDVLVKLLRYGATRHKNIILQNALFQKYWETAMLLVREGLDVNSGQAYLNPPLVLAMRNEWRDVVEEMIQRGASLDVVVRGGRTNRLIRALRNDWDLEAEYLIQMGANVNRPDCHNNRPIDCCESLQSLNLLINAGAEVSFVGSHRVLFQALENQNTQMVKCLLRHGVHVDPTAFQTYASRDNRYVHRLALAAGGLGLSMYQNDGGLMCYGQVTNDGRVRWVVPSLQEICRRGVRHHLLAISPVNLFVRVRLLPITTVMQKYLVYDLSIDP